MKKRNVEHPENVPEWLALAREAERNKSAFASNLSELRADTFGVGGVSRKVIVRLANEIGKRRVL